jgi:hypothetical protein
MYQPTARTTMTAITITTIAVVLMVAPFLGFGNSLPEGVWLQTLACSGSVGATLLAWPRMRRTASPGA